MTNINQATQQGVAATADTQPAARASPGPPAVTGAAAARR